jgi:hypothetical protein
VWCLKVPCCRYGAKLSQWLIKAKQSMDLKLRRWGIKAKVLCLVKLNIEIK